MIPPKEAWRSMSSAPKDGSIFMAYYHEYGKKDGPVRVQACQYLCDWNGKDWRWRDPWRTGATTFAEGWLTLEELIAWQEREPAKTPGPSLKDSDEITLGDDMIVRVLNEPTAPVEDFDL
jgi:hypothetical protein